MIIDSGKGIGPLQNLISGTRVSEAPADQKRAAAPQGSPGPKDEVTLSPQALSLAQANDTASKVRSYLQSNTETALGLQPGFDESL